MLFLFAAFEVSFHILPNSIVLLPTNRYEIEKIINELKSKKATGIDEISAECLKAISPFILDPLVHIINMCIEKGTWPKSFKNTVVIPYTKMKIRPLPRIIDLYH